MLRCKLTELSDRIGSGCTVSSLVAEEPLTAEDMTVGEMMADVERARSVCLSCYF